MCGFVSGPLHRTVTKLMSGRGRRAARSRSASAPRGRSSSRRAQDEEAQAAAAEQPAEQQREQPEAGTRGGVSRDELAKVLDEREDKFLRKIVALLKEQRRSDQGAEEEDEEVEVNQVDEEEDDEEEDQGQEDEDHHGAHDGSDDAAFEDGLACVAALRHFIGPLAEQHQMRLPPDLQFALDQLDELEAECHAGRAKAAVTSRSGSWAKTNLLDELWRCLIEFGSAWPEADVPRSNSVDSMGFKHATAEDLGKFGIADRGYSKRIYQDFALLRFLTVAAGMAMTEGKFEEAMRAMLRAADVAWWNVSLLDKVARDSHNADSRAELFRIALDARNSLEKEDESGAMVEAAFEEAARRRAKASKVAKGSAPAASSSSAKPGSSGSSSKAKSAHAGADRGQSSGQQADHQESHAGKRNKSDKQKKGPAGGSGSGNGRAPASEAGSKSA